LPCFVVASLVVVTVFAERQWHLTSMGTRSSVGSQPDWIDRSVPSGTRVAIVYTGHVSPIPIWETEFFNRAAGPVYDFDEPMLGDLPETQVEIAPHGRLLDTGPIAARYGMSDGIAPLAGMRVATLGSLILYRLPGHLGLASIVDGLYPSTAWSGRQVVYR